MSLTGTLDPLKSWHNGIFGVFGVCYVLGLDFDVGFEFWFELGFYCLFFFPIEIWVPGLHRMIPQSYSWTAGSKSSTASKNGKNVTKNEKCMSVKRSSKIEFFMDQSHTTSEITSLSISSICWQSWRRQPVLGGSWSSENRAFILAKNWCPLTQQKSIT